MGFQNPSQNYTEHRLTLGDLVYLSPHSTYLLRSASDYPDVGIMKGSLLVIDRGLTPQDRQVVIVKVDDELVLRRLQLEPVPGLQELSGQGSVMLLTEEDDALIWGVVAYVLTDIAGLGFNQVRQE
ncbi:peptidase [Nissabacter archeti]|uniref:Peptidase n=2 Tax=Nissabacter archeti TaxID=1917880 RepID=A0ABS5JND9_9GAMM|nr:peptidase [Nissabacter archeti]